MTYRSPLLVLPGAVEADPPDRGVAAHYGDPFREQRALDAGSAAGPAPSQAAGPVPDPAPGTGAFVDLSHRPVIRVTGPDRLSWLHSITTQHLSALPPYLGTTALVLSPHGHVEHALYLVDDGTSSWMHAEPGTIETLLAFLASMRFLLRVEVEDVTAGWAVVWEPVAQRHPAYLTRVGEAGRDLFIPRGELAAYASGAGAVPAGLWAYEALRVAARRPRLGFETDHRTIPHEIGWLDTAVHLKKGCYRGQETVARVHNLGRPPRRLVFLHLDGSAEHLPAHGDPVERGGQQGGQQGMRNVGFVTSSARHHELGPIALALVKRATDVDLPLVAGGVPAAQELDVASGPDSPPAHQRTITGTRREVSREA